MTDNPWRNPALAVELTLREREALMTRADWHECIGQYLAKWEKADA